MMMMRLCQVQVSKYDFQASMYSIINTQRMATLEPEACI